MLRIAVSQCHAMSQPVQPRSQVYGDRRFPHPALGIRDSNNHVYLDRTTATVLASSFSRSPASNRDSHHTVWFSINLSRPQSSKRYGWLASSLAILVAR
jgi:hypothetical protein